MTRHDSAGCELPETGLTAHLDAVRDGRDEMRGGDDEALAGLEAERCRVARALDGRPWPRFQRGIFAQGKEI